MTDRQLYPQPMILVWGAGIVSVVGGNTPNRKETIMTLADSIMISLMIISICLQIVRITRD